MSFFPSSGVYEPFVFQQLLQARQLCPLELGKREKGGTIPKAFQSLRSLHQIFTSAPFRGFEGGKGHQGFLVLIAEGSGTENSPKSEETKGRLNVLLSLHQESVGDKSWQSLKRAFGRSV